MNNKKNWIIYRVLPSWGLLVGIYMISFLELDEKMNGSCH